MKTIAVMTSGGDAPGMNAAIRSVTRVGLSRGLRVIGFQHGYEGILYGQFEELGAGVSRALVKAGPRG